VPPHQFLQAAAVLLLLIAAVVSFFAPAPEPPRHAWGHTSGWLGLACFVLAGLVP
jgi:hypothetical protein